MWKGATPLNFINAKALRKKMTNAEKILWHKIRSKKLNGYKFRRQHPVQRFIADFYCHELKLIIEVDGAYHKQNHQKEYDKNREEILRFQGIEIIRFSNEEVFRDLQGVLQKILIEAEKRPPKSP